MSNSNDGMSCQTGCWALAAGIGLLTMILLLVLGDYVWPAAIFLGGLLFVLLGLLFSWLFCAELPKPGEVTPGADVPARPASGASVARTAGAAVGAAGATAEKAAGEAKQAAKDVAAKAVETASEAAEAAKDTASDAAEAAKDTADKAEEAVEEAAKTVTEEAKEIGDLDKDGKLEGTGEGTKPEMLSEAREGGPDNLKEIKGIGPKLEQLCHSMGVFHFDQIASWGPDEVAWMDANLQGFRGRVTRDDWVGQAKILASGGETEFSQRVDKGDVY